MDTALVFARVTAGASVPLATSVLGLRIVTVWLPLVPGWVPVLLARRTVV